MQRLRKVMPHVIGCALCVSAAVKLYLALQSSPRPDPSTGRTEPLMIDSRISTDWDYVTQTQMMVFGLVLSVVVLLALAYFAMELRHRFVAGRAEKEVAPVSEGKSRTDANPSRNTSPPSVRSFGRRVR